MRIRMQSKYGQANRALTDSPLWMRRIASAKAGATESTVSLRYALFRGDRHGVGADDLLDALQGGQPVERVVGEQPVRADHPDRPRPCARRRWSSSSITVLPLAISSSSTITSRSVTSPITALIRTLSSRSAAWRRPRPSCRASGRTPRPPWRCRGRARPPRCRSGRTPRKCSASSRSACRWSTGTLKKPCTCGECRVIARTRSAPGGLQQVGDQPRRRSRCAARPSCRTGRTRSAAARR